MICNVCGANKPPSAFPRYQHRCVDCRRAVRRAGQNEWRKMWAASLDEPHRTAAKHSQECTRRGVWFGPPHIPEHARQAWLERMVPELRARAAA